MYYGGISLSKTFMKLEPVDEIAVLFGEEVCPEDTHDINGDTGYRAKDWIENVLTQDRLNTHKAVVEILQREIESTDNGEVLAYLERAVDRVNQLFGVSK